MHTSKILQSTDFQYRSLQGDVSIPADFATFCPDYHALDRVGVVSPCLEVGIRHVGYALLALTTAFYDVLRAEGNDFFDYPHHFAFLDANPAGVRTRLGRVALAQASMGAPWGGLDVWPDSNWIMAPESAAGMLKKVFDWQISRLFWPEDFVVGPEAQRFPVYVRRLLSTRLKSVYYYNTRTPSLAMHVTPQVEELVHKSLHRLPAEISAQYPLSATPDNTASSPHAWPYVARYRRVSVAAFLDTMAGCFETT
jgi:hypothetical protein